MSRVHRISPRADLLLRIMAKEAGKKPSDFLSELIVDYHKGLTFAQAESEADQ